MQAQSFQAKAQSLEKAAEAQDLQARAVVHAHAQVEAQAQAHHLVAQANDHAQAYAHASAQADQLKKLTNTCEHTVDPLSVLCGCPGRHAQSSLVCASCTKLMLLWLAADPEVFPVHNAVAVQANHLAHEAHSHAQLQTELTVHAQSLAAKAQAHAQAQVRTRSSSLSTVIPVML